ncbi:hypothetical protein TL16_g06538 [Triparma laevis f. inornata]|uniref:Uncharacterized protein n=1 Tax=Triparma laevis f. inornata TaxID=1714386 RepID=A0A9W7AP06_9STRA|nr:hypothetical protein TL16_g06538 [Triparma laevis f. inornata]
MKKPALDTSPKIPQHKASAESEGPYIPPLLQGRGRNRVKTDPPRLETTQQQPLLSQQREQEKQVKDVLQLVGGRRASLDPCFRDKIRSETLIKPSPEVEPPSPPPPTAGANLKRRKSLSASVETSGDKAKASTSFLLRRSNSNASNNVKRSNSNVSNVSSNSNISSNSESSSSGSDDNDPNNRSYRGSVPDPNSYDSPDSRSSRRKSFPGRRRSIDINATELAALRLKLYVTKNIGILPNVTKIIKTYEELEKLKPGMGSLDQLQRTHPDVDYETWEKGLWAVKARIKEIEEASKTSSSANINTSEDCVSSTTYSAAEILTENNSNNEYIGDPFAGSDVGSATAPGSPTTVEMLRAIEQFDEKRKETEKLEMEMERLARQQRQNSEREGD